MQQNLVPEMQTTNSESITGHSEAAVSNVNVPVTSVAASEASRMTTSTQRHVEYGNEASQNEQLQSETDRNTSSTGNVTLGKPGNESATGSGQVSGNGIPTTSAAMASSAPVRGPLSAFYQRHLLEVQLQQLRLAQATGLVRSPLASQPVILSQLTQLRFIQQQLATQQQLLQKQPQTNPLQAQQLALQQQQIGAMMQQIQQQLLQQQQLQQQQQQQQQQHNQQHNQQQQQTQQQTQQQPQQQQQQQQIGSGQFPTPAPQPVLNSQPQLQQLLLQQRKQLQQQQQQQQQQQEMPQQPNKQTPQQPPARPTETEPNSGNLEDSSSNDIKSISPRTSIAKEPVSLVQVVNSAPASPSTSKSRLGQWTQNSIQTECLSPKPSDSGVRDRNVRASPQPETSEKSTSLLITRSTSSPNLIQTTSNSSAGHRVLDPVSSKWGIDAAPKLSAEPPEFKPGVPWRPYQSKANSENLTSETPVTSGKTVSQDWSNNSIGNQTVSSNFTSNANMAGKTQTAPIKTVPNSQNFSQASSSAIWQTPSASRQATVQRPMPLTSSIGPPPGLGNENSFLNLPDVHSQSGESNWGAPSNPQMIIGNRFSIRAPAMQPWSSERRDVGWPSSTSLQQDNQLLDSLSSVPRANELRNLAMLGESSKDGINNSGMRVKPEMSGQTVSYNTLSTWLVIRNINPRVSDKIYFSFSVYRLVFILLDET